jgi:MoaA/NifB/PqqE/SkfB family radical SAM enzyme
METTQALCELSIMRHHSFDMLIFFVTGHCNAKCRHCFYWRNLGPTQDGIPLENIKRLAESMSPFRILLFSGGEPTLRSDLPQLVEVFRRNNQIQSASIPTNGLLPNRIAEIAHRIAELDPQLLITFNVSIDGFAEVNDLIRGVVGGFSLAMQTLHKLRQVAEQHDNFRVLVNTVICADNYHQVIPFAEYIKSTELVDGHFFEIVRGDPPEDSMKAVPPEELQRIYKDLVPIQEGYLVREAARRRGRGLIGIWRQVTDVGNLINRYRHQWAVYSLGKKWDFPCVAGEGIGVIDYNGRLRVCELRECSIDLADCDYDFSRAWSSALIRREAAIAKTHTCDCTHTCFLGLSMRQNLTARFFEAPWLYLLYKAGRLW